MTKIRVLCLREGDSNTKSFHRMANSNRRNNMANSNRRNNMANSNRRNNSIDNLNIDGVLTSDQEVIEDDIAWFYKSLYLEDKLHCPHLDVLNFSRISKDKAGWLE